MHWQVLKIYIELYRLKKKKKFDCWSYKYKFTDSASEAGSAYTSLLVGPTNKDTIKSPTNPNSLAGPMNINFFVGHASGKSKEILQQQIHWTWFLSCPDVCRVLKGCHSAGKVYLQSDFFMFTKKDPTKSRRLVDCHLHSRAALRLSLLHLTFASV